MTKIARSITPDNAGLNEVKHDLTLKGKGTSESLLGLSGTVALLEYTPTGDDDSFGTMGQLTWDDDNLYIKTSAGWASIELTLLS
jgi:hypothetical protein